MAFKKKINRQLKNIFGAEVTSLLNKAESNSESFSSDKIITFLEKVETAYDEYEDRLNLSYRNLKISTEEVDRQTKKINSLNTALANILESLGEGLLVFDKSGIILPTYSRVCAEIFETNIGGKSILDLLTISPEERPTCELWLELIFDGKLDNESINSLGPQKYINSKEQHFELSYNPIIENSVITGVTLVAQNKTLEHLAHQESLRQQRRARILDNILKSRNDFNMFLSFFNGLTDGWSNKTSITENDFKTFSMNLHTLKGSCGHFALDCLTQLIQREEEKIHAITPFEPQICLKTIHDCIAELQHWLSDFSDNFSVLFGEKDQNRDAKYISRRELVNIIDKNLSKHTDRDQWILEIVGDPIEETMKKLKTIAEATAQKLDKEIEPVNLKYDDFNIINSIYQNLITSFSHVVRNSIDHGLESRSERLAKGKSPRGQLDIEVNISSGENSNSEVINFIFKDDGRGFDFTKLKNKLRQQGVYDFSDDMDIVRKASDNGISSKASVDDVSGFGIGISALFREVEELNGNLTIESEKDIGTTITISIPRHLLPEEYMQKPIAA